MREAGLALGVPHWRVAVLVLLPAAGSGIATGIILAVARVAGETAPLLFTAFGNEFWQRSLLKPIDAVPLRVYKYAVGPYDSWHALAQSAALVLIAFVLHSQRRGPPVCASRLSWRPVTRHGHRRVER